MKKWLCMLLMLTLLLPAWVQAEDGDLVAGYGQTFPRDTTVVDLKDTRIVNEDKLIKFLKNFPNLEHLITFNSTFKKSQVDKFMAAFPGLKLDCQLYVGDHRIRTDATSFSTFHSQYQDKSPHHRSSSFELLKYCYNLKALDLGHNDITDLSFMAHMTDLRILILADNDVTDISVLRNMKNLQYCELFMNQISDLTPLEDLPLLDLNLAYNAVTDWSPLEKIETLERAWLYSSGKRSEQKLITVPQEVIDSLLAAQPGLQIDNESGGSTGGGWRKHPRYKIIYNAIRDGNVLPLEPTPTAEPAQ